MSIQVARLACAFLLSAGGAWVAVPTLCAAETAPASTAVEANKAKQREVLRGLKIVPRAAETPVNLDDVILDWTDDGYVRAAKLAGTDGVTPFAKETTNLAPLKALSKLKTLELSGIVVADLKVLTGLGKLEELKIIACDGLKPVAEVARLRGLQRLVISNSKVGDTAPLKALSKITEIDLIDADISDVAFVSAMPKLGRLVVAGSPKLQDAAPIGKLKWLRVLDLSRTGVLDVAPLAKLEGLKSLKLPKGVDIAPLAKLAADGCTIEQL